MGIASLFTKKPLEDNPELEKFFEIEKMTTTPDEVKYILNEFDHPESDLKFPVLMK